MGGRVFKLRVAAQLVVACLLASLVGTASAGTYSKLIVFGNSLSDNGNLFAITSGAAPSDPPYYQGRHSNGPVWPQFLAASLGVPEENHAVSGARSDYTNVGGPYPGLRTEIDNYIAATPWGADSDALYILWAGSNDFLSLSQASAADTVRANAVANVVAAVSDLAAFGIRHLAVVGLADLGLTPFANSGLSPLTPSAYTAQSSAFNNELRAGLDAANLPLSYIWIDAFSFSQTVTSNPGAYGFSNVADSCLATACTNPEAYLYFDDRHPSTATHQVLADHFYDEIIAQKLAGITVHRIASGNNDAEERASGSVSMGSSDLELVYDSGNQTVGMRFTGVDVPQGATISNAYIQFQVDEVSTGATSLQIYAQAADNAAVLQNSSRNISNRTPTSAVAWNNVPGWTSVGAAGAAQRTPNLASVIEEVVNRAGWQAGNALLLVVTGTGERVAESYNGKSSAAPLLHIEYGGGTPTASAPDFNPGAGSFSSPVDVVLTSTSGGADLYYTLDGSTPNPDGGSSTQLYTGAISVTTTTTIKALARAAGFNDSTVATATYTVQLGGGAPVLAPVGNQTVTAEQTLTFAVSASDDNGAPLLSADLSNFPSDNLPSFTTSSGGGGTVNGNFSWTPRASEAGQTYSLVLTATDNTNSALTDSESVEVNVLAPSSGATVEYRISSGDNDAEERASGSVSMGSSDLELVYDSGNQTVGMRFTGVDVPQGATISNAYIQFQVDEVSTGATSLQIYAQAADNAAVLQNSSRNISNRTPTSAVAWNNVPGWTSVGAAGAAQRTPNLASVIQEVVNRAGWQAGNALLLVVTGTGERVAESYNGKSSAAPLLHIEYEGGGSSGGGDPPGPGDTFNAASYAFADVLSGGGSASAEEAIDGYVATSGNGWVPSTTIGAALQLDFDGPKNLSKIVLSDLTGAARVNQATIRLSDGQSLQTGALTDDGTPVEFPVTATSVTWVRVTIDAATGSAGLGEIEAHVDLDSRTLDYQDDFNDNTASGTWSSPANTAGANGSADWVESGGRMTLSSSILGQTSDGYNLGSYRILSGFSHAGMDLRLRVKTNSIARFGLMFAMQNANNYYRLSLSKQMSHVKLEKVAGGTFSELAGSTQTFVPGEWTNLRVILDQGIMVAYVNGEHIIAATDSAYASGQIALFAGAGRSYYDEPIHFDNLAVLSSPTEPVLAIMNPVSEFAVFPDGSIPLTARVINAAGVDSVRFTIDGGTDSSRPPIVDGSAPYTGSFGYGPLPPAPDGPGDHQLLVEALDSTGQPLTGPEASVRYLALGVRGVNAVLVGDSISTSIGDDDPSQSGPSPDISGDGRNSGGGFGPILNNELTAAGLGPVTVIQGAHPGDKASHGVNKVDAIVARNPSATDYLVMFGSNDAYGSTPVLPTQYQAQLLAIVSVLEATGANVYVATPPAVDEAVVGDSNRNETLQLYRAAVIELVDTYAPTNGQVFHGPDFFTRFETSLGPPGSDDLLGDDGLHPDGYGYAIMADDWRQCMEVGCDYL